MPSKTFRYESVVRENHLDSLGHMNHIAYLQLFEEARWQMGYETKLGFDEAQTLKKCPMILDIQIRFHREMVLREGITIETTFLEYRKKIAKLEQVMYRPDGEKACTAMFTYAVLDLVLRKLILPPDFWLKELELS